MREAGVGAADSTCRGGMKSQSSCWVEFMGQKLEAADGMAQHLRYIYWCRSHQREEDRMAGGWNRGGGHLETGLGTGGTKPIVSLTVEHIFSVAGPDLVVGLLMGKGAGSCGITGHHVEACIGQLVKSLL